MRFVKESLSAPRPTRLRDLELPRRQDTFASPGSWQDEVVYFLLVDRFSDGAEASRPLLDRTAVSQHRPAGPDGQPWRWDRWAESGKRRYQGGTIVGVTSKLDYLAGLGITTVWLSPVFRQRGHLDTYHGYGVQDFLDVDPRYGRREDLVELVRAAHARGMRVLLDVIFNHSGANWLYPPGTPGGELEASYTTANYPFGHWRGIEGEPIGAVEQPEDGAWPRELQNPAAYTRAGTGDLGSGSLEDDQAEFRRSDFEDLRDFSLDTDNTLHLLAACYMYWIALTDCDGFRIDTVKHVTFEQARNFCGSIKEFAVDQGKRNFLLVGEIAGGDTIADRYLQAVGRNLDAALDIGESRLALRDLARGLTGPERFFAGFEPGRAPLGSHRLLGDKVLSVLDDHDHVAGDKLRFATDAANDHQAVAATAIQLLTLGIPCLYYGTEQGFAGPEPQERRWLPGWGTHDRYLREAMFGPDQPRAAGRAGLPELGGARDPLLPGFGPFGTAGAHCFDPDHPVYRRVAALVAVRAAYPVLRAGRQYLRPVSLFGRPFQTAEPGELVAWSRILVDEEALCVVNPHGTSNRGADVLVDPGLNPPGRTFTVLANTAEAGGSAVRQPVGTVLPVRPRPGRELPRDPRARPERVPGARQHVRTSAVGGCGLSRRRPSSGCGGPSRNSSVARPVVPTMIAAIGTVVPSASSADQRSDETADQELRGTEQGRGGTGGLAVPVERDGRGVREGQAGRGHDEEQRDHEAEQAAEAGDRRGQQHEAPTRADQHGDREHADRAVPLDQHRVELGHQDQADGVGAERQTELLRRELVDALQDERAHRRCRRTGWRTSARRPAP